jgi:hypothetical protein
MTGGWSIFVLLASFAVLIQSLSLSIYLIIYIYMHRYIHTYSERERVKQHYNAYCGKPNNKLSLISPGLGCTKPPKLNG